MDEDWKLNPLWKQSEIVTKIIKLFQTEGTKPCLQGLWNKGQVFNRFLVCLTFSQHRLTVLTTYWEVF